MTEDNNLGYDLTLQESESDFDWLSRAEILCQALPFLRKFADQTFVIKIGGAAMASDANIKKFAEDVVLLKKSGINVIIVHGGGPQIGQMLEKLNVKTSFIDGIRVTCKDSVEVVEMVLSGSINKMISSHINNVGGLAFGISGKDANLIKVKKLVKVAKNTDSNIDKILNLGYVGEPEFINTEILEFFDNSDIIPVIAPIGVDSEGNTYNINADTVAGAIASTLSATKLLMLSDVDGIKLPNGELVSHLTTDVAEQLIKDGIINKGMIPKVKTCIDALDNSVEYVHILNGSKDHILLMEIFTESGAGTMIFKE
ncbi:acetylglutamate kinase [Rickettsiales bacterium]|nr:acetylglutamate kinase [Rickettsiales bacterium]MDB2550713.1 acetylglutamate kinase [Rickettsiales bacterium]